MLAVLQSSLTLIIHNFIELGFFFLNKRWTVRLQHWLNFLHKWRLLLGLNILRIKTQLSHRNNANANCDAHRFCAPLCSSLVLVFFPLLLGVGAV